MLLLVLDELLPLVYKLLAAFEQGGTLHVLLELLCNGFVLDVLQLLFLFLQLIGAALENTDGFGACLLIDHKLVLVYLLVIVIQVVVLFVGLVAVLKIHPYAP
jgi:hypothetical protein